MRRNASQCLINRQIYPLTEVRFLSELPEPPLTKAAHLALGHRDTVAVLSIVLSRMYTLRNQVMHGGATWDSGVNREQVRDGGNLLGKLVPVINELMLDNVGTLWGDAYYPVVA